MDDPHNNREQSKRGEERLDLVHSIHGSLTPRSKVVKDLVHNVISRIYVKYKLSELAKKGSFKIEEADFELIVHHLLLSEAYHYFIEEDPTLPSHSSGDVWAKQADRFQKVPTEVPDVSSIPETSLLDKYREKKKVEGGELEMYRQIIQRWIEWKQQPEKERFGFVKGGPNTSKMTSSAKKAPL